MSSRTFSGLSRLGSINPSRRIKDPEELEEEVYEPDFKNTSNEQNLPVATAEGGISPESFDVRSNKVINTEEEKIPNYENLGRQLGNVIPQPKEPELSNEQKYVQPNELGELGKLYRTENPVSEIPQESFLGKVGKGIKNFLQPHVSPPEKIYETLKSYEEPQPVLGKISPPSQVGAQEFYEKNPEIKQQEEQKQAILNERLQKSLENPMTESAYGSVDEISKIPDLQEKFEEITGMQWTEELAEKLKDYESVMDERDTGLQRTGTVIDERINDLNERIKNNQATDTDKYYIGLSLALPLIIGGFFGAEAGLATLGGAAKGISEAQQRREKQLGSDQEALNDFIKLKNLNESERSELQLKKAALPSEIKKSLPQSEYEQVEGFDKVTWKDPTTGNEQEGVVIRPGLVVKPSRIRTEKDKEKFEKRADKLTDEMNYVDNIQAESDDLIKIASLLKDNNLGEKFIVSKIAQSVPGSLSKISQDINWNGKKVNAGVLIQQKLGFIYNLYAQAQKLGQLDRAAQEHMKTLFSNPTNTIATKDDFINQLLNLRKLTQRSIINRVKNEGFDPIFIASESGKKNKSLYDYLNGKVDDKELEEVTKKMSK